MLRRTFSSVTVAGTLLFATPALADEGPAAANAAAQVTDAKRDAPIVAYSYTAYGSTARTYGARGYGLALAGSGQKATAGGGVTLWGAPIDRLTLVVDAPRDVYLEGHFAPSLAVIGRILGGSGDGFSLGVLGKYKVEGFGTDPNGDTESEIEGGFLVSYALAGLHLDLNTVTGFGLTDEGEIDTEGRFRFGYDLGSLIRVGLDAQGRYRLAGTNKLLNGSSYDYAFGPQIMVGSGHIFAALTAGPATMGVSTSGVVGASAIASLSGTM